MKFNPAIFALAIGAFGIGVTEFAPMGMLPTIAGDLAVSIPTAGFLVTAYAIGVVIGAPLMTLTTGQVPRRTLLIGLMGIFTAGNLFAALSQTYDTLLAARLVTSLNHGAFFGVGSVVAAGIVPADKRASAVAAMFMGLTIANVGGVPLAAWAGEHFGWRTVFWAVTGLGLLAMLSLRLALPALSADKNGDMRAELRVLVRGRVLGALALTVVGSSSMFTVFTYIAPILATQTGGLDRLCRGDAGDLWPGADRRQLARRAFRRPLRRWDTDRDAERPHPPPGDLRLCGPLAGAHGGAHLPVGYRQFRAGPAASDARHEGGGRGAESGLLDEYRRFQSGQCDRRRDRGCGHRLGFRLPRGAARRRGHGGGRARPRARFPKLGYSRFRTFAGTPLMKLRS
jgi:hypothetical protein